MAKKRTPMEYLKTIPDGADPEDFVTYTTEREDGEVVVLGYSRIRSRAPRERGRLSSVRADVWDKTTGHCWHCGRELHPFRDFHIDHLIPFSRGGSDDFDNLVPACSACNLSKGGKRVEDWRP
ncbi:MAG: HNH endonuclease [Thermomicrobiales bacterium]|nr:HNH endonuclease [Thermomicrobiales bacterium]